MPSPVLHCAVGAAIYSLRRGSLGRKRGRLAGLIIIAALLPDIDFLPGLIVGDPNRFHNGPTHSILFAILAAGMLTWLAGRQAGSAARQAGPAGRQRISVFILTLFAGLSHPLLDGLAVDERAPFGVPIFWPVSDLRFQVEDPWFDGIDHGSTGAEASEFFDAIISVGNAKAMAKEFGIGAVAIGIGCWIGRRRRSRDETE
ncbi:MAG: metal-dependent hydrolase [Planctomycetes bacterium]|nr:metal-dependent hydrolase [Planctomycetota bacterium]